MKLIKRWTPITVCVIGFVVFLVGGFMEIARVAGIGCGAMAFGFILGTLLFYKNES